MKKFTSKEITALKASKKGMLQKNITQWAGHCDKLTARKQLSKAEKDDLEYRRLQVSRWTEELEGMA